MTLARTNSAALAVLFALALFAFGCAGSIDENQQGNRYPDSGLSIVPDATVNSCNPSNCSGCCKDNICLPGTSDYLCGSSAIACQDCAASGSSCSPDGTCTEQCQPSCAGKCPGAPDGCGGVCTANDCSGCCDGETCKTGDAEGACGIGGAFCQDCGAASGKCSAGRCESTKSCTPASCPNGCCDGDVCRAGVTNSLCGGGGGTCQKCASDQVCKSKSCEKAAQCTPSCKGKCAGASDGCGGHCKANDCAGCCHGTSCYSGTSTYNCGTAGALCQRCSSGDKCTAGSCTKACVPSCAGKCAGAADGCGGVCAQNDCKGCCAGTTCYSGVTTFNCGKGGAACDRCSSGETCSAGACIKSCTPNCAGKCTGASDGCGGVCAQNTCNGCCQSKICFGGTSTSYCGKSGGSCDRCESYEYCSSTQGGCAISSVAKWTLKIVSASLSTSKAWDNYSSSARLPDVRVRFPYLKVGGVAVETRTIYNDYTPEWNQSFGPLSTYQLDKTHTLEIVDYDSSTSVDVIGRCTVTISKSTLQYGKKSVYTCKNPDDGKDYLYSLKLELAPAS